MSGSVDNPWALLPEKDHLKNAFDIAKQIGHPQNSYDDLVKFLQSTPAEPLNKFSVIYVEHGIKFNAAFGPIIESMNSSSIFPFLSLIE